MLKVVLYGPKQLRTTYIPICCYSFRNWTNDVVQVQEHFTCAFFLNSLIFSCQINPVSFLQEYFYQHLRITTPKRGPKFDIPNNDQVHPFTQTKFFLIIFVLSPLYSHVKMSFMYEKYSLFLNNRCNERQYCQSLLTNCTSIIQKNE